MTYRNFTIALILGGLIGLLVWLICGRRDEDIEYPEQPEPLIPWWQVNTTPIEADGALTWTWVEP